MALRRASSDGVRGISPTNALAEAQASPSRPVNSPTTSSTTVSDGDLQRSQRQPAGARQRGDRAHPVTGPQQVVVEVRSADLELLAVADPGLRGDDDPGAAEVDPPAQVDVVAVERDRRVEAAERTEQVGPHQQARRGEHEDVADGVVLLLVVLAGLGDRVDLAEAVEAEPDVLEHGRVVPRDELGPHDAGVGAVQLLDEGPHGVRLEDHVVVAEAEEPALPLDEAQDLVGRRPEAGVGAEVADEGVGEALRDAAAEVLAGRVGRPAGQEEERVEVRVVLVGEGRERLLEPRARGMDDDDRDDRGRERGVGFHGGARLSAAGEGSPSRSCHLLVAARATEVRRSVRRCLQ